MSGPPFIDTVEKGACSEPPAQQLWLTPLLSPTPPGESKRLRQPIAIPCDPPTTVLVFETEGHTSFSPTRHHCLHLQHHAPQSDRSHQQER